MRKFLLISILFFSLSGYVSAAIISGVVKDAATSEEIIGATVVIKGNELKGAITDIDGSFIINDVENFPVTLIVGYMGYTDKEVVVEDGKSESLDILLEEQSLKVEKVVVVGRKRMDSEVGMVSTVKLANSVIVGVSGAQIAKTADSDAGEVVKRVPGVSIIDDRFVVVRGLPQRYNNVWINNGAVPSSEADGRAFSFDMVPSASIDNMIIAKSYSADLPGDFSGGFVKITTKSMPKENSLSFSLASGFNTSTQFSDFKLGSSSSTDWLGFDSQRGLSKDFPSHLGSVTDDTQKDNFMRNGFNDDWGIKEFTSLPDIKLGVNWNQIVNENVGMIFAFGYNNTNKAIHDMENNRYTVYDATNDEPIAEKSYIDNVYSNTVKLNAMNNWSFKISPKSTIQFMNLYNMIGTNRLTQRYGTSTVSGEYYENQTELYYSQRISYTGQLIGNHTLDEDGTSKLDWSGSYSIANKNEPDRRIVSNLGSIPADGVITSDLSSYNDNITRYFQELTDNTYSAGANYTKTFTGGAIEPILKSGIYGEHRSRSYTPREFVYRADNLGSDRSSYLRLPFEDMVDNQWIGSDMVVIDEITDKFNAYDGQNTITAAYVTTTVPIGRFNLDLGVRGEYWNMSLEYDNSMSSSTVLMVKNSYDKFNILPAANLSYNLTEKQLLRVSYGRTLNRPEFREVSPSVYYDFDLFAEVVGNTELEEAIIDNFDIRYELYPATGETVTVGAFYKRFENPIEWNFIDAGGSYRYSYENAESAYSAGIEVDVRKKLGFIGLPNLTFIFNGSLVASEVQFAKGGLVEEKDRPLQGQSPYIVNTGLYYASGEKLGLSASLLYNIIGKRIIGVGKTISTDGNTDYDVPDTYEMPRNVVDFTIAKRLGEKFTLKLTAKDLLNEPVEFVQFPTATISGAQVEREQVIRSYRPGTSINLGFSYNFK